MKTMSVSVHHMLHTSEKEQAIAHKLAALNDEIAAIRRGLSFQVKAGAQINRKLTKIEKACELHSTHVSNLSVALSMAAELYADSETKIVRDGTACKAALFKPRFVNGARFVKPKLPKPRFADGTRFVEPTHWQRFSVWLSKQFQEHPIVTAYLYGNIVSVGAMLMGPMIGFIPTILNGGQSVISYHSEKEGTWFGLPCTTEDDAELFGIDINKSSHDFRFDVENRKVYLDTDFDVDLNMFKYTKTNDIGDNYKNQMDCELGHIDLESKNTVALDYGNLLAPQVYHYASNKASAEVADLNYYNQIGDDKNNIHWSDNISILHANAGAGTNMGAVRQPVS